MGQGDIPIGRKSAGIPIGGAASEGDGSVSILEAPWGKDRPVSIALHRAVAGGRDDSTEARRQVQRGRERLEAHAPNRSASITRSQDHGGHFLLGIPVPHLDSDPGEQAIGFVIEAAQLADNDRIDDVEGHPERAPKVLIPWHAIGRVIGHQTVRTQIHWPGAGDSGLEARDSPDPKAHHFIAIERAIGQARVRVAGAGNHRHLGEYSIW